MATKNTKRHKKEEAPSGLSDGAARPWPFLCLFVFFVAIPAIRLTRRSTSANLLLDVEMPPHLPRFRNGPAFPALVNDNLGPGIRA